MVTIDQKPEVEKKKRAPAKKKTIAIASNNQQLQPAQESPATMMIRAKEAGLDADQMREMLAVQKDWEANEARKAYHLAVAAFKAEEIHIVKDRTVKYGNNDKSVTEFHHASLANIVETSVPYMSRHGLSHAWNTEQGDGGVIGVTCKLTHELGHSESTKLQSSPDQSGKKNNIQAIASTITYLERYTFLAITGLATRDMVDDDGAGQDDEVECITANQVLDLEALISEVGADHDAFLKVCKVESFVLLPASKYHGAVGMLEAKRQAQ